MDVRLLWHESDRHFMAQCATLLLTPRHYSPCSVLASLKIAANSFPSPRHHLGTHQSPPSHPHVPKDILHIVKPYLLRSLLPSFAIWIYRQGDFINQES